jgi:hypothetical protein
MTFRMIGGGCAYRGSCGGCWTGCRRACLRGAGGASGGPAGGADPPGGGGPRRRHPDLPAMPRVPATHPAHRPIPPPGGPGRLGDLRRSRIPLIPQNPGGFAEIYENKPKEDPVYRAGCPLIRQIWGLPGGASGRVSANRPGGRFPGGIRGLDNGLGNILDKPTRRW